MGPVARGEDPRTIHAHVAVLPPADGRTWMGVVFVDNRRQVLRRIGRTLPATPTGDLAAFRGILYALWNSRRLGSRWVIVHSDSPDIVAQINGDRDVDPSLVGLYLEVRALLHAYRSARVEVQESPWGAEALAVAEAARAGHTDDILEIEDLPLWAGRPMQERFSA
jgi:hypothetical protein